MAELCCRLELQVCLYSKPGVPFFKKGLKALCLSPEEVVMVGEEMVSDVGGAQKAGIRVVIVRTAQNPLLRACFIRAGVDEPHETAL